MLATRVKAVSTAGRALSTQAAKYKLGLIPSDGIGREVVPAAVEVLESVGTPIEWVPLEAGFEYFQQHGTALPEKTIQTLKNECQGALFGAVSSPSHKVAGYSSPIVALRKHLDLYANIRPVNSSPLPNTLPNIDMIIVRENTECLYVKQEKIMDTPNGKVAIAERVISEYASRRIAQVACKLAMSRGKHVTIVHKSNVLSVSDGLFRETALGVCAEYPELKVTEQLVDSCVYRLFRDPHNFDVIVAPNMYGDILSDGAAAVVGGLGIVSSANMSDSFCLAEPVHGSAPDIAGKGIANPIATVRAAVQLLEFLGEDKRAQAVSRAVQNVLASDVRTPDLGGRATTREITDALCKEARALYSA
eukprot:Colp12_sorted_trinity150504_noHs@16454